MRTDFAQLRRLPDLLFPRRCPFCGSLLGPDALQGTVCPACVPEEMRLQHIPARLPEGEHDFYAVREAAAAYYYEDIVRTAVLRCKRGGCFWYARELADRVAVLYAGQIVELGTVEDVFYDPRHPYTWAMLSSLPQLAQRNTELYSITGTPPSLYNKIVGDPFAPRNPYCLKIDTLQDAPMFKVSDTHYAKTWLLDPRAPKIEKPEIICNLHEKLVEAFNI